MRSKTDPSVTTLERVSKAMDISLADSFTTTKDLKDITSFDKSVIEKVNLIDGLPKEEKQTIYTMLDAFVSKRKLKDALKSVLHEAK